MNVTPAEVMKALEYCADGLCDLCPYTLHTDSCCCVKYDALELIRLQDKKIKELEESKKSCWISAVEALPKENKSVLVTVDGNPKENITLCGAYFLAEYSKKEGWILEGFESWSKGVEVTFWHELPDSPCVKMEKNLHITNKILDKE